MGLRVPAGKLQYESVATEGFHLGHDLRSLNNSGSLLEAFAKLLREVYLLDVQRSKAFSDPPDEMKRLEFIEALSKPFGALEDG